MIKNIPQSHGWMQEDLEKDPDAEQKQTYLEIGEGDINFNTSPLKFKFNPNLKDRVKDRIQHMLLERRKKLTKEASMERSEIIKKAMEKLAPGRPPKKFLTEMKRKLKKQYPGYGDERLTTIAAGIWHNYDNATKNKLTKEYEG